MQLRLGRNPGVVLLVAACLGIGLDRAWAISPRVEWTCAMLALGAAVAVRRRATGHLAAAPPKTPWLATLLIVLATLLLAASWHHARWWLVPTHHLVRYVSPVGKPVPVQVRAVTATPVTRLGDELAEDPSAGRPGDRWRFLCEVRQLRVGDGWRAVCGRAWVSLPAGLPPVSPGDSVAFSGELLPLPAPLNPAQVDFRDYQRAMGIRFRLRVPSPDCVRIQPSAFPGPRWWLPRLRVACDRVLGRYLSPRTKALACAVLLGTRDALSHERRDPFLRTGTAHLLSISGLHVGILAGGILLAVRGRILPFRSSLLTVMFLMVVYGQMTDARAPVLRAGVLVQLMCLSWLTARRGSLANSLAVAGLVVLIWSPANLFLPGTQFSFLAVAALGRLARSWYDAPPEDPLDRLIWRSRPSYRRWLRHVICQWMKMASASAAVWLVTAPLTLQQFHLVSPIAILLNLILWLPLATALLSGFTLLLLAASGSAALASAVAVLCDTSLWLLETIVRAADQCPGTYSWGLAPGGVATGSFYLILGLAWAMPLSRRNRWTLYLLAAICPALGCGQVWWARQLRQDHFRCAFLSVGHGACVVLELPGGETWLYDAGRLGDSRVGVDWVSRFLWSRGITRLDRILLSHADVDHFNLMPELIERFSPTLFLHTGWAAPESRDALNWLQARCRHAGVEVQSVHAPQSWQLNGCQITVRHPPPVRFNAGDNALSLVVEIEYGRRRVLLTGDLEGIGLDQLLAGGRESFDLVMAPHHGSPRSDPSRFVAWCRPKWLVISSGDAQAADHVARSVESPRPLILNTAREGAIEVEVRSKVMTVTPFRCRQPDAQLGG